MATPGSKPRPRTRIACIGQSGQTAQALSALAAGDDSLNVITAGRDRADLGDSDSLARFIDETAPDAVINAGAYNFVDMAEQETAQAFALNAEGPRELARQCRLRNIPFIHMSSDCVFDGLKTGAYTEDDAASPISVYGRSKRGGELAVLEEDPSALVIRVCWVFSQYGDNFASKMIELASRMPELRVVNDQFGTPTYAPDIAAGLLAATRARMEDPTELCGLLHFAAPDVMSRSDMATRVLAESFAQGGPTADVIAVSSESFNAAAARPANAALSNTLAVSRLGLAFTPWSDALSRSVSGILART